MANSPFTEIFLSTLIILLSIPFSILFLILLVTVALPVKLWCRFVSHLAHLSDPDIVKIVTGLQAGQIRDFNVVHKKPRTVQVACLRFNGSLKYDEIAEEFNKRVVKRLRNGTERLTLQYPELQQYFVKFLGYVFLKWDRQFDHRNHFTFYNPGSTQPVGRPELMNLWESLMSKPFPKQRSPWEFVVVDNYKPDPEELEMWGKSVRNSKKPSACSSKYFVIFVRMHHGLGDGFTISKMLSYLSEDEFSPSFPTKITPSQKFFMNLRAFTLGPYDTLNRLIRYREDYHDLHRPASEQSHEVFIAESNLIPTSKVKAIKEKFRVSFTVILIAAISGGLRKYFLTYKKPVPKFISAAIPFSTAEHSDQVSNEFSVTTVGFGVQSNDPKERVNYVQNQINLLTTTSWMVMLNFLADILGSLPMSLFSKLLEKQGYGSTYSTLPGPKKCINAFGATMLEVNFSNGNSTDSTSYGLSSITYNDYFRVTFFVDTNVIKSRAEAENVVRFISEEFEILERYHDGNRQEWRDSVKND